jgi:hypothetical protein
MFDRGGDATGFVARRDDDRQLVERAESRIGFALPGHRRI